MTHHGVPHCPPPQTRCSARLLVASHLLRAQRLRQRLSRCVGDASEDHRCPVLDDRPHDRLLDALLRALPSPCMATILPPLAGYLIPEEHLKHTWQKMLQLAAWTAEEGSLGMVLLLLVFMGGHWPVCNRQRWHNDVCHW